MTESAAKPRTPRPTPRAEAPKDVALVDRARERAGDALDAAAEGVEANPLSILAGGIALGVLAGVAIPRSAREAKLLGPVGAKLNEGVVTAAKAARDAGKAELAAVGLSRVGASDQVNKLVEGAVKALSSAGAAAKDTRKPRGRPSEG